VFATIISSAELTSDNEAIIVRAIKKPIDFGAEVLLMRIQVRLPKIQPDEFELPEQCPNAGCSGKTFKAHGIKGEIKAVRDTDHKQVTSLRYKCVTCGRTFRVYPTGVS
jgi:hypothetical protein